MWSISTSLAAVQVAPSYGEYQVPDVDAQAESVTTLVPSRLRTVSRVLHVLLFGSVIVGLWESDWHREWKHTRSE
jgi:hypothetical protein